MQKIKQLLDDNSISFKCIDFDHIELETGENLIVEGGFYSISNKHTFKQNILYEDIVYMIERYVKNKTIINNLTEYLKGYDISAYLYLCTEIINVNIFYNKYLLNGFDIYEEDIIENGLYVKIGAKYVLTDIFISWLKENIKIHKKYFSILKEKNYIIENIPSKKNIEFELKVDRICRK